MKKLVFITYLLISCMVACCQNNFVFFRYNLLEGASSVVVEEIDNICNTTNGKFVLYYSENQEPTIINKREEWQSKVKGMVLSQQSSPDYYNKTDIDTLNEVFQQCLEEKVSKNNLFIRGQNDKEWRCTFILSEQMLNDIDNRDMILRIVSINQFIERGIKVKILFYNDSEIKDIDISALTTNMFNYNK